jgi:hypothetical protein
VSACSCRDAPPRPSAPNSGPRDPRRRTLPFMMSAGDELTCALRRTRNWARSRTRPTFGVGPGSVGPRVREIARRPGSGVLIRTRVGHLTVQRASLLPVSIDAFDVPAVSPGGDAPRPQRRRLAQALRDRPGCSSSTRRPSGDSLDGPTGAPAPKACIASWSTRSNDLLRAACCRRCSRGTNPEGNQWCSRRWRMVGRTPSSATRSLVGRPLDLRRRPRERW